MKKKNKTNPGETTGKTCFLWHSWMPRLYSYESFWSFSLVRELRYLHSCEITLKCMYLKSSLRSSLLRCEICFLETPNGDPVLLEHPLSQHTAGCMIHWSLFCSKKDTVLNEDHIWATLHSRSRCFKDAEVHFFITEHLEGTASKPDQVH